MAASRIARTARASRACLMVLVALGASFAGSARAATFSDGAFVPADWTVTTEVLNLGGTVNPSQVGSGGNPTAFRQIDDVLNSTGGGPFSNSVFGFHARVAALWNPAVDGPIVSLDYSEDAYRFAGSGVQANGIALRQGGVIYYGPGSVTPATTGVWQPYAWAGLVASNFDALAPGVQNPDFSAAGGTIQFGFFRANSTSTGGGGGTASGGIDNWSVTIHPVVTSTVRSTWGRVKALYGR
jgi:hypothetical protein